MTSPSKPVPQAGDSRINTKYYIFTLVHNTKIYTSSTELHQVLKQVVNTTKYSPEWSSIIGIEIKEQSNVLHLHTFVTCHRKPWTPSIPGYNLQYKEFPPNDIVAILNYITKHDPHPCAIQQREQLSKLYLTPINQLYI